MRDWKARARSIVFSLPVSSVAGLRKLEDDDDASVDLDMTE